MRMGIKLLLVFFALPIIYSNASASQAKEFSAEEKESISILQNSFLYFHFNNPDLAEKAVQMFVQNLQQIAGLSESKCNEIATHISTLAKDSTKQFEGQSIDHIIEVIQYPNNEKYRLAILGVPLEDILLKHFTKSEYENIIKQVKLQTAKEIDAYKSLSATFKELKMQNEEIIYAWSAQKHLLDEVFEYYKITY